MGPKLFSVFFKISVLTASTSFHYNLCQRDKSEDMKSFGDRDGHSILWSRLHLQRLIQNMLKHRAQLYCRAFSNVLLVDINALNVFNFATHFLCFFAKIISATSFSVIKKKGSPRPRRRFAADLFFPHFTVKCIFTLLNLKRFLY